MASIIFKELDDLQYDVFNKLSELINLNDIKSTELIELERNKVIKQANKLILKFGDYLKILENRIISEEDRLKFEIYCSKLANLKLKLRDIQLFSNNLENELIHKQRIDKFTPKKSKISGTKEDLFAGRSVDGDNTNRNEAIEDQILFQNKKITSTLQSTKQLLSSSIIQTELNIDTIDQQTKDLTNLNEQLFKLSDILDKSSKIVNFIDKQDRQDKRRIYLSIYFFICCCFWVIWRRILKTPARLLLWSFFKIFRIFNWLFADRRTEILNNGPAESIIATTVASVLSMTMFSSISSSATPTSSFDLDKEFIMDIEDENNEQTWDDIVSKTATRIIEEL